MLLFLICIPKERLPNGIFYIFSSIFPIIILALESQEEHCLFACLFFELFYGEQEWERGCQWAEWKQTHWQPGGSFGYGYMTKGICLSASHKSFWKLRKYIHAKCWKINLISEDHSGHKSTLMFPCLHRCSSAGGDTDHQRAAGLHCDLCP